MRTYDTDVAVIGGGVSGTALYFAFCKNVRNASITLLEKSSQLAQANSKATGNSQTLHTGDIETNYSYEHALKLRKGSIALKKYCLSLVNRDRVINSMPKMVLAVGDSEISQLRQRFEQFKEGFNQLQWFDWSIIRDIEPNVALKDGVRRSDPIVAMGYTDSYCAINYEVLADSFISQANKYKGGNQVDSNVFLSTLVTNISPSATGYRIDAVRNNEEIQLNCRYLVVSAGAYSLYFAKKLGFAKDLSLISAAGGFYYSSLSLNGKVYTMQQPGLPFAAVHGDADIALNKTRFGPTLLPIPKMERYSHRQWNSAYDYYQCISLSSKLPHLSMNLLKNKLIRRYLSFEMPYIGRHYFCRQVSKILPDIKPEHLQFAKGVGGVRPLLVNHQQGELLFGESKIYADRAIFNVAPATGASTCLNVAMDNLEALVKCLELECQKLEDISILCA